MGAAAFFDLDRTLLVGASGVALGRALRDAGVTSRSMPGEAILYGVYNRLGETLPNMAVARQAARFAKGWPQEGVRKAAAQAAPVLVEEVGSIARDLIEEHHRAGRPVVLATTTPYDLVKPLADALGMDDVVATRYGVADDGSYDGTIVGPFVWGSGKLTAVRTWAKDHDVDVATSWAYSDSFYDIPLLSAVGHPGVVNPDPRLRLVALARRWPVMSFKTPDQAAPGVPKVLGVAPQQVAMAFARPDLVPYARFDIQGTERIPSVGAAIVVANHRSYFDATAVGMALAQAGRTVRFLGKKELFDAPVIGALARAFGGIRVDRGTGSDEPLQEASQALAAGELVAMMPQGTIPRGAAFFDPELKGRWGVARLAALSGAPVVPVGLWGTEKVWPRSARLPNMANVLRPPTVLVKVGQPVELTFGDLDDDTVRIMAAIVALLPPEARERRAPTDAELRRTMPPGYRGDPSREADRRPGSD